ncbi:MAG: LacI family DNA-binding transcriptional regulator [Candidatus Omnitrophica bacterium]|nr:LacI family DNA-binding transcriptional regulator [Candidatus Omnitrophota bacterium]
MAVTLKDIAKSAGVSYSTVSRVVNRETANLVNSRTRERVLRAVEKYGYVPNRYARSLKVNIRQTRIIGFTSAWFPHIFMGEFVGKIMTGAFDECEKRRYDIELFPVIRGETGEISRQLLFGRMLDGILVFGYEGGGDFFERLMSLDIPHAIVNCYEPSQKKRNFVYCDGRKAASTAVTHLMDQGYREVAIIVGSAVTHDAKQRLLGYEDALKAHGLDINPDMIFQGSFVKSSGYEIGEQILKSRRHLPRAVFCSNDDIAIGLLRLCHDRGIRCPEEVALVGFDDTDQAAYTFPPLTTIQQPAVELGQRAVQLLDDLIEKRVSSPVHLEVPTKLIVRSSSISERWPAERAAVGSAL